MTRATLRALAQHADPQIARLASEALFALRRVEVRRAELAGAPTHTRPCGDDIERVLGPGPQPPTSPEAA